MSSTSKNRPEKVLLSVENLHVAYGKVEAVRGISLAVPEGGIVAIVGPNGAGKSSLLNALAGALPASGNVRYAYLICALVVAGFMFPLLLNYRKIDAYRGGAE